MKNQCVNGLHRTQNKIIGKLPLVFTIICLMGLVSCKSTRDQAQQYSQDLIRQLLHRWDSFELKKIERPERRFYAGKSQGKILSSALGLTIGLIVIAYFGGKYWEKFMLGRKQQKKTLEKVEKLYDQMNIKEAEHQLLVGICGTSSPDRILKLIESAEEFELCANEFSTKAQDEKALSRLYRLRHQLGFGFYNKRIPLLSTQMLVPADQLVCSVVLPQKTVTFLSSVVFATEKYMVVKSPTRNKKPVDLSRFSNLLCKVSREDSVEYQFILPIRRELRGKVNGIVLGQTREIQALQVRDAERVPVNISTTFHVITEKEFALYMDQPEYLSTAKKGTHFKGTITDISTGGINVGTVKRPDDLQEDALLVFSLEGANLRGDVTAKVLKIEQDGEEHHLHLQYFRMREIKRIRLNKFIEQMKKT